MPVRNPLSGAGAPTVTTLSPGRPVVDDPAPPSSSPPDRFERAGQPQPHRGPVGRTDRGGFLSFIARLVGGGDLPVPEHPYDQPAVDRILASCVATGLVSRAADIVTGRQRYSPAPGAQPFDAPHTRRRVAERVAAKSVIEDDLFHLTSAAAAEQIEDDGFKQRIKARPQFAGHGTYLTFHYDDAAHLRGLVRDGEPRVLTVKSSLRAVGVVSDTQAFKVLRDDVRAAAAAEATRLGLDGDAATVLANESLRQLFCETLGLDGLVIEYQLAHNLVVFDPARLTVVG